MKLLLQDPSDNYSYHQHAKVPTYSSLRDEVDEIKAATLTHAKGLIRRGEIDAGIEEHWKLFPPPRNPS